MRDVAALAGVSLKTVSRVVNREDGVSDDLVAKVERAAIQLDYRPNLTASNLRRSDRKTATWGLLLEDVANPFSSAVHRGVEEVARELGVAVFTASMDEDPEREALYLQLMHEERISGLIFAPTRTTVGRLERLTLDFPTVLVDRAAASGSIDSVVLDNPAAMGALSLQATLATTSTRLRATPAMALLPSRRNA
jgi:LacI family fructose operon transcriptional repressor